MSILRHAIYSAIINHLKTNKIMIKLSNTDYVLWDKANDHLLRFENNDDIIIYGNKEEAEEDSGLGVPSNFSNKSNICSPSIFGLRIPFIR